MVRKSSIHLQTLHLDCSKGTKLLQGARLVGIIFEINKKYLSIYVINLLEKSIYKVTKAAVLP